MRLSVRLYATGVSAMVLWSSPVASVSWPDPVERWRFESEDYLSEPVPYPSIEAPKGIVVGEGGDLVFLDADGQVVWRTQLIDPAMRAGQPDWARERIKAPVVADVDGDRVEDIIAYASHGEVFVVSAAGELRWRRAGFGTIDYRMFLTAGDVDGDGGSAEIVVPSNAGRISCLNGDGSMRWQFAAGGETAASPVVADLDGDGRGEVVYGTGSRVIALSAEGKLRWMADMSAYGPGFNRNRPMVLDADDDGRNEVYILDRVRNWVVSLDAPSGDERWAVEQQSYLGFLGLIAGNLSGGNGRLDLITTGKSTSVSRITSSGEVLWDVTLSGRGIFYPPAIADLNGDGEQEVIVGVRGKSFDDRNAAWYVVTSDGQVVAAIDQRDGGRNAPLVADIDGNGRLEVISGQQHLTAWEFPFEGGSVEAGFMWAGDNLRRSETLQTRPDPDIPQFEFIRKLPVPQYGTNRVSLSLAGSAQEATIVEVSVRDPSGYRWSRLFPGTAQATSVTYPLRLAGQYELELRQLTRDRGAVQALQTHRFRLPAPLAPVEDRVEVVAVVVNKTADQVRGQTVRGARFLRHRAAVLRADLAPVMAHAEGLASLTPGEHEELAGDVRRLLKQARRSEGLANLMAAQSRAGTNTDLVMWEDENPWDLVNPLDDLPADEPRSPVVEVWGFGNERESRVVHVLNTSPTPLVVRLELGTIDSSGTNLGVDRVEEVVRFSRVLKLPTKHAERVFGEETEERVPELLPALGKERLLSIAPGEVADLWLEVSTYGLAAGDYVGRWPVTTLEPVPFRDTLEVHLRVSPVSLPAERADRPYVFHPWVYPINLSPSRLRELAPYLKQAGVNAAVLNLPYAHVDSTGARLTKPLDWSMLVRIIDEMGPLKHLLFQNYAVFFPEGVEPTREQRVAGFKTYADAIFPHMEDSLGLDRTRFSMYVKDEPGLTGQSSIDMFMERAQLLLDSDPRWSIYSNYAGTTTMEQLQQMAAITEVWQPDLDTFFMIGEGALEVMRQGGGKVAWWFKPIGDCLILNPLGFYRSMGRETFRLGMEGWGFWSLRQGASLWKTALGEEPGYVTIGDDGAHFTGDRRWQAVRDGTEDFTAFMMLQERLEDRGADAEASAVLEQVRGVTSHITYYSLPDLQEIQRLRLAVEEALVRMR